MRQLSLTEARAKLSTVVRDVNQGKGPVAIAQRSKIKAVLVDAEWHSRVEEELAQYRKSAKRHPLKLRGSIKLVGDIDQVLTKIREGRQKAFDKLLSGVS